MREDGSHKEIICMRGTFGVSGNRDVSACYDCNETPLHGLKYSKIKSSIRLNYKWDSFKSFWFIAYWWRNRIHNFSPFRRNTRAWSSTWRRWTSRWDGVSVDELIFLSIMIVLINIVIWIRRQVCRICETVKLCEVCKWKKVWEELIRNERWAIAIAIAIEAWRKLCSTCEIVGSQLLWCFGNLSALDAVNMLVRGGGVQIFILRSFSPVTLRYGWNEKAVVSVKLQDYFFYIISSFPCFFGC